MAQRPSPRGWPLALIVFLVGVGLRLYGLGDWSLWEDEETTIYFSYHPGSKFPRAFPTFFVLLGHIYSLTGCSVLVGRVLSAAIGILSLALSYLIARRFAGARVALIALVVLVLSPGHLFWSQSIRYYGLVICLQLAAIWLFLEGIRRQRVVIIALSLAPIALAMTAHVSAVLILPVLASYLLLIEWRSGHTARLGIMMAWFIAGVALLMLRWAPMLINMMPSGNDWLLTSARNPTHVVVTGVFYFGAPAVVLALIGAWRERVPERDEVYFFVLLAGLPALMLVTLAALNLINVTYYYGLISLVGVAILAGYGAEAVARFPPPVRLVATVTALLYYAIVLAAYFGPGHGDRPRWREAAEHIANTKHAPAANRAIYAQVPGVIAFYSGVPASDTMGHPSVKPWPAGWTPHDALSGWFVAEERLVTREEHARLDTQCVVSARLPARMIVRDRTVVVYWCASH